MLKFIKEKNGFKSYQADNFRIYYGEEGAIAGDNSSNPKELIYLIEGELKVSIGNDSFKLTAPAEIEIPEKTYHKAEAVNKVSFLVFIK